MPRKIRRSSLRVKCIENAVREPSLGPAGQESEIAVRTDDEIVDGWFLWFPRRYAVLYMSEIGPTLDNGGRNHRRYTGRSDPAGPVTERFEPEWPISVVHPGRDDEMEATMRQGQQVSGTWLREGLYVHLQHEKYRKWWSMPDHPLQEGEVMYFDKDHGAHLWDAYGTTRWESIQLEEAE